MGRARAQRTAHDVVDAASEVVAEGGLAGLSVEALAAHMRTSRSALYRFFPGKGALIAAVVESRVRSVELAIEVMHGEPQLDALDGLLQVYLSYANALPVSFTGDLALLTKASRDRIAGLHAQMRGVCAAVVEHLERNGGPAMADADLIGDLVHSAALAGLARAPAQASSEERAQQMLTLVRPWFAAA